MILFGSVKRALGGVLSNREYSTTRNRFSSVITTMSWSAFTAMELQAGFGSLMYRAGFLSMLPLRVRTSTAAAKPNTAVTTTTAETTSQLCLNLRTMGTPLVQLATI